MTGTIKTLPPGKSFGFILGEGGTEYFFHASDVARNGFTNLQVGDTVAFEAKESAKGPRAAQVRKG